MARGGVGGSGRVGEVPSNSGAGGASVDVESARGGSRQAGEGVDA
jgi:hypothetical protein